MNFLPSTNSITSILDKAGSATRTGIVSGAKALASGIDKTGGIIKARTAQTEEEKKIAALPHIEKASKATSLIVGTTHKYLGKAVNKTIEVAEDAWYSMPESELMKKICENPNVQIGLEVGKAGASAGANIIGGVSEGLTIVTNSSVKTTVDVVQHKYGEDAGKATKEGLNIAGDIFGAYRLTYTTGIIAVTAGEVMKIKEEEAKLDYIIDTLTRVVI